MQPELTHELLLRLLHYDPATGDFRWKFRTLQDCESLRSMRMFNTRYAGGIAGSCSSHKGLIYRNINLKNLRQKDYLAHRLAWFYMYKQWPTFEITHKNSNTLDNCFDNLIEITRSENAFNKPGGARNTTGYRGVSYSKYRNKYQASVTVNQKQKNIGRYDTKEEAAAARIAYLKIHDPAQL